MRCSLLQSGSAPARATTTACHSGAPPFRVRLSTRLIARAFLIAFHLHASFTCMCCCWFVPHATLRECGRCIWAMWGRRSGSDSKLLLPVKPVCASSTESSAVERWFSKHLLTGTLHRLRDNGDRLLRLCHPRTAIRCRVLRLPLPLRRKSLKPAAARASSGERRKQQSWEKRCLQSLAVSNEGQCNSVHFYLRVRTGSEVTCKEEFRDRNVTKGRAGRRLRGAALSTWVSREKMAIRK